MSFIKRAQEAAEAARARVEDVASAATRTANDPATTDRINRGLAGAGQGARDAVGMAKRGVNTVIERIDPGVLADLVIKATALQEMTNRALRTKGLSVPHRGDLHHGLDPARRQLRDQPPRRGTGGDRWRGPHLPRTREAGGRRGRAGHGPGRHDA